MKNPKPEPVVVRTLCSLCDQEWEKHGDNPTTLNCIELLKDELGRSLRRPQFFPSTTPYVSRDIWYSNTTSTRYLTPPTADAA